MFLLNLREAVRRKFAPNPKRECALVRTQFVIDGLFEKLGDPDGDATKVRGKDLEVVIEFRSGDIRWNSPCLRMRFVAGILLSYLSFEFADGSTYTYKGREIKRTPTESIITEVIARAKAVER